MHLNNICVDWDIVSFQTPDTDFEWKLHNGQIQENKD